MSDEPTIDEREGVPSCSGLERIYKCPGSWQMEQKAPPKEESLIAESGTKIHAVLARQLPEDVMTDDEVFIYNYCVMLTDDLIANVFGGDINEADQVIREKRLWLLDDDFEKTLSGKADLIVIQGKHALVTDYKTGRGEIESTESNTQLRGLAILVSEEYSVEKVTCAIIKPNVFPNISYCDYAIDDIQNAKSELAEKLAATQKDNAPIIPGIEQCKYCKAKSECPSALGEVKKMASFTIHNNGDEIVTDETITELLNNCSLAEKMIGTIRAEARRRIKDNASAILGWKLKPGTKREKISDVQTVWERLSKLEVKAEDFSSACSITKTALKPLIKFATNHKGKALDEDIKAVIDGCTTTTQSSPQLERIKEIE